MRSSLIFIFIFLAVITVFTQDTIAFKPPLYQEINSTDILIGVHWQGNTRTNKTFRYYEIGMAKGRYISHMHGVTGSAFYISEEMYFSRDKNIFGTKVGAWIHWVGDIGLAMIYYTDFDKGNLKIRPEFGWGMGRFRAICGFNIPTINNKVFKELQKNNIQVSIQFTIGVHKKIIKNVQYKEEKKK